ncbi:caspase-7-like [Haliotis rubra]|uniref:caspase-7-like n=1 Tax=Haliotis rubra TaxID=36100 RepID=UPI001EE5EEA7|nr:caspase-7-like [Haliotis rubra]
MQTSFLKHAFSMEPDVNMVSNSYKMDHERRGLAVIINNTLGGMGKDGESMVDCLTQLGFDVTMYSRQTMKQMKELMRAAAASDHSGCDCFVCVILADGGDDNVKATDGTVKISSLVAPFKGHICKSLAGKPKLFFMQGCRGRDLDHGVTVGAALSVVGDDADDDDYDEVDGMPMTYKIPSGADFLLAYSTVAGYQASQNPMAGSYYINALCSALKKYSTTMDLLRILILVNKMVARGFQSSTGRPNNKSPVKQMPSFVSMLTKDLIFTPKEEVVWVRRKIEPS